jgi:cyclophilin family peptidyl-prolyl cis-trans isomerase
VPNRRTRHRQLARVAQRRYAERRRRRQRRARILGGVAALAVVAGVVAFLSVRGGGPSNMSASGTPTSSVSPSASPGAKTGTVQPPAVSKDVACGGTVPKAASKAKPQFAAPPTTIDPNKTYTATIRTSCGTIVVRLLADRAPKTVNSFVFLAEKRFFDGTQIHRIDTSIDVIQGGDPTGTGTGGPGYSIPDELGKNDTYAPGVVAMANSGPNTGGSQFFVVFGPNGHTLDANPNYTIFGRVVQGMDVARRIGALPVQDPSAGLSGQHPKRAVYIDEVTISTKG